MTQEQVDYTIEKLIINNRKCDIKLVTFFGGEPALEMDIIENTVKKWYHHPEMEFIHFGIITGFAVHQDRLLALQREFPKLEIAISFDVDMRDRPFLNNKPFDLLEHVKRKYNIDMEVFEKSNNNIFFNKIITGTETNLFQDLQWMHETYNKHGLFYSLSFTKTPKFLYEPAGQITDHFYRYLKYVLDPYVKNRGTRFLPQLVLQYLRRYWERDQGTAISGCGLASEYFIDSNGTISPCSISHHQTDLMLFHEGKFLDNTETFQTLEAGYWDNPTCQSCEYKGFCPGGCMVFRYMENKDYNVPNQGQCTLMEEIFAAYKKYLTDLSEEDYTVLVELTAKDLAKYYEYCQDNASHIDLHDIYQKA
jgi:radical SAM protein with 4Fe4S-binding SPASM domain